MQQGVGQTSHVYRIVLEEKGTDLEQENLEQEMLVGDGDADRREEKTVDL